MKLKAGRAVYVLASFNFSCGLNSSHATVLCRSTAVYLAAPGSCMFYPQNGGGRMYVKWTSIGAHVAQGTSSSPSLTAYSRQLGTHISSGWRERVGTNCFCRGRSCVM